MSSTEVPVWQKWVRGLLGGSSNALAIIIVSPLDVMKIRFQTQGELCRYQEATYKSVWQGMSVVLREEGLRGLFKGLTASMLRELTFSSTRMGLYEPIRNLLAGNEAISLQNKIIAGLTSGAIAAALFNPFDVLKADRSTTKEGRRYKSLLGALVQIANTEGVQHGLYKGVGTTCVRAALLTGSQMASYDHAKHTLLDNFDFADDFKTHFCASMFAGFMTSLVTNPIDVVRTRLMNASDSKLYANPFDTFVKICRAEGGFGLYKGFVPSYLRLGSATVIAFMLTEQLRLLFGIPTI